jgi:hypothetical protein
MTIINQLADNITPGIKFTVDIPTDHEDGKTPMLDTAVWVERSTTPEEGDSIRYSYYEKPTTSPLVFHAAGAHGWRSKITTLAMEVVRRMTNSDRRTTIKERAATLRKFTTKMADSGYGQSTRLEILKSGITRYYRMLQADICRTRRLTGRPVR